jgi:hypothetical protein
LEEDRRKNHIVIFGLENGIERYIDMLEVETKFVTEVSDLFLQNSLSL